MSDSDEALVARATDGDRDALSELLRRFGPQVRERIAPKIGEEWRSAVDVEDVMQVTYLDAFLRIQRFTPKPGGTFLAWLTRVAENNIRDAIRELGRAKRPPARKRIVRRPAEDSSVDLLDRLGWTTTTPSRNAAAAEVHAAVESAIGRLPADYQYVLRAYELEGRSGSDVAESMGRSLGAVYMLRARALDELREGLGVAMGP